MKVKRYKRIRKTLQFYKLAFGIRTPYKVVMDDEFLQSALEGKVQLKEQLPKFLQEEHTTGYVTRCIVAHLSTKGKHFRGAHLIGQSLPFLKCRHDKTETLTPAACIQKLVGDANPDRLLVAAQNAELRAHFHNVPGVPLIYMHSSVPVLETPSATSLRVSKEKTSDRFGVALTPAPAPAAAAAAAAAVSDAAGEAAAAATASGAAGPIGPPRAISAQKAKKPKGVNPLSMKAKQSPTPLSKKAQKRADAAAAAAATAAAAAPTAQPKAKKTKTAKTPQPASDSATATAPQAAADAPRAPKRKAPPPAASASASATTTTAATENEQTVAFDAANEKSDAPPSAAAAAATSPAAGGRVRVRPQKRRRTDATTTGAAATNPPAAAATTTTGALRKKPTAAATAPPAARATSAVSVRRSAMKDDDADDYSLMDGVRRPARSQPPVARTDSKRAATAAAGTGAARKTRPNRIRSEADEEEDEPSYANAEAGAAGGDDSGDDSAGAAEISTNRGSRGGIHSVIASAAPAAPAASQPPTARAVGTYPSAIGDSLVGLNDDTTADPMSGDDSGGAGLSLAVESAGCCSVDLIRLAAPGWTARLRASVRDENVRTNPSGVGGGIIGHTTAALPPAHDPRVSVSGLRPPAAATAASAAPAAYDSVTGVDPSSPEATVTADQFTSTVIGLHSEQYQLPAHRLTFSTALSASIALVGSVLVWSLIATVITLLWLALMWSVYFRFTVPDHHNASFARVELDGAEKWHYVIYLCAQSGIALAIPFATLNAFLGWRRTRRLSYVAVVIAGVVFPIFLCTIQAVGQFDPRVWIAPFQLLALIQVIAFGWSVSTHWHTSSKPIAELEATLSPAPGAESVSTTALESGPVLGGGGGGNGSLRSRRAGWCDCSWPRARTTLSIVMPQIVGQSVPILFVTVGFDFYSDTPSHLQPYILGLVLPLATVGVHIIARLFAYRLMGRISEAALDTDADVQRDDIPVVTGSSDAWTLSYLLTFLLSLSGRVMVSSVQGGYGNQAIAAAVLGCMELLARSTIEMRDALGHRMFWCRRPLPSDSAFFSDSDKVKFLSDTALGASIATYVSIGIANGYVLLSETELNGSTDFSVLLIRALARTGIQLAIAIVADVFGAVIQLKLAFPLLHVWRVRWQYQSFARRQRWLLFIILVSVTGGLYFGPFGLSLLRRQAART